jgi:CubicO group peptidase (beta-lactamase class C family)
VFRTSAILAAFAVLATPQSRAAQAPPVGTAAAPTADTAVPPPADTAAAPPADTAAAPTADTAVAPPAGTAVAPPATAQAPPAASAEALIGLWAYRADFGPALRGTLTIRRAPGGWRAAIGGLDAPAVVTGDAVRIQFGARGGFRGRRNGHTIAGFWLQPSGATADRRDPGGSGQPFATPVALRRIGPGLWRGTVTPLDDRFTLYLSIFRAADGALTAAFRNPELNLNGGASRFLVSRAGDAVRFNLRYDGGEIDHRATLLHAPDRLRLNWDNLAGAIELGRIDPAQAAGFFPRPPGALAYVYRAPPATGDGWRTAPARDLGVDEAALARIIRDIAASDPTARPPALIHSILVAYRGRLVLEEYFFGHDRDAPHDTRSAGKTLASVMLGAAMLRGTAIAPETRIVPLLAAGGPFANPDPRKDRITLAQLMTHSAGIACNDNDEASPGNEGRMQSQAAQPDWWRYTLDLPIAHDPGRRYAYCSANINLVGGALTAATGTWLPEYFERTVARPLQFGRWHWNLMANGEGYLGGGAFLRSRDLLKIGQAYLAGGVWNGRRIVTARWVAQSTAPWIEISPATTGYSEEEFGNYYGAGADGLAWHLNPLTVNGRAVRSYAATGNGGQVLLVVPEYDLAVVFTGGNYMQGGVWGRWGQTIVADRIIPALRR